MMTVKTGKACSIIQLTYRRFFHTTVSCKEKIRQMRTILKRDNVELVNNKMKIQTQNKNSNKFS